ncbi:hypothetical protein LTR56_000973 [Elasticomyces elasticus]|nr:hypothetical protein LTR22_013189 [Elasticomyces elasticus]KAK3660047.1 hypothetical protein LTR56_000973 [Elasticomyces elasticus]KAK4911048.1 hypothetical protein LTR49_020311 [Elasticomyces elasticus]
MDKVESPPGSLVGEGDGAQNAAERVFAIVELFEMIFDLVDSVDIIRCRRVSYCIYKNIAASRTLHERLCLRPIVSAGSVRHVPVTPSFIELETSHACGLFCPHVAGSVEISALGPTEGSPKMWERMFLSQPPIKVVRISYLDGYNGLISGAPPPCASSAHVESPPAANAHRKMPVMGTCISCQKQIFVPLRGIRTCFGCRRRMVTQVVRSEAGIQFGHLLQDMDGMIETIKKAGGNVGSGGLVSFAGPFTEGDNQSGRGFQEK